MKKMVLAIVALVASLSFMTTSSAMANEKLLSYATGDHLIGGELVRLSNADVLKVERFLNQYDISDSQADEMINNLNQIKAILNNEGVRDITKLSKAKKEEVLNLASSAASIVGASITYNNADKTLVIYDADGKKFDTVSLNSYLRQTGSSNLIYVISAATLLLGAVAIRKSRNA